MTRLSETMNEQALYLPAQQSRVCGLPIMQEKWRAREEVTAT